MPEIVNRSQQQRHAAVVCALPEDVLLLKRFRGAERLGGLFEYELELVSEKPDQVDPDQVLGAPMAVRLELPDGNTRYFHGIVSRFVMVSGEDELPVYHASVVPWLWMLTRSADCRIFHDTARQEWDVPKIVLQVFRDFGASAFRNALSGTYQKLEYTVQYAETAYNFVNRLLEREGIYYFFEHTEDGHTLVLADASTAHEPFPGYDTMIYRGRDRTHPGEEHVFRWEVRKEVQPGAVALGAFNFKQPSNDLTVRSTTQRPHPQSDFEVYDFPGSYIERDVGEQYARVRLEEFQCQYEVVHGEGNVRGLACGSTFKLSGLPGGGDEEYLVTSAEYMIVNDAYQSTPGMGTEEPFTCRFTAIPLTQTYRPPRVTPRPLIRGPQTARVVGPAGEEIHTDQYGRVRVQFPWDRRSQADEKSSCWIRVAQAWAGKKWGAIFTPRIGQEVIVEYLEGDPDRPVITGRVYNGDNPTPYDLPANATMSTTKSLSSKGGGGFNEIRFEDKKGAEQIFIHGQRRMDVRVRGGVYETNYGDREVRVGWEKDGATGGDFNILVKEDVNQHVKGSELEMVDKDLNQTIKGEVVESYEKGHASFVKNALTINAKEIVVEGSQSISLKTNTLSLQGSQAVHIKGGSINLEASMGISLKVGGNFVVIGPSGVQINGTMVQINSGGSPTAANDAQSAAAAQILEPVDAAEADTGDPGQKSSGPAAPRKPRAVTLQPQKAPDWKPPVPPPATSGVASGAASTVAGSTAAPATPKSRCPGKSPEVADKGIQNALAEQKKMLEARKAELDKWDQPAQDRFKKWFGTTDEAARKKMQDRVDKEIALNNKLTLDSFHPAEPPKDKDATLFAYVYPDKDDKIYLGQQFCNAAVSGTDSKAGTLCHEMSHFDSVGGTKDVVYGSSNCESLAKKDSAKALQNADSFEYFCEGS